ncbi:MAG: hypothetical protein WAP35_05415, partial [Solirubrobacterales bacterium]
MPTPPAFDGKSGADRWPARLGVLSAILGFVAAQILIAIFALIFVLLGGQVDGIREATDTDPIFIVIASILQGVVFAATGWALARSAGPVRLRDFGLVKARFWPTVGMIVA